MTDAPLGGPHGVPAPAPAPRRLALLALLLAVGTAWGGALVATKVSISTGHHPVGLIFWQLAISVAIMGAVAAARGLRPALGRQALIFYGGVAVLGTLAPNIAALIAAERLPAGVLAIVIALAPMSSLMLAALLGIERPGPVRIFGVALGAAAIAMLLGPATSLPDPAAWPFVAIAILTPFCYGAEGIFVKLRMPEGTDPVAGLLGASLLGLAALAPAAAFAPGVWVPLGGAWGAAERAILLNGVLHAGCYWGYLRLVGLGGPVFASTVSYIVTLAAVGWGVALLDERHSGWIWAALAVMVTGMALVRPRR